MLADGFTTRHGHRARVRASRRRQRRAARAPRRAAHRAHLRRRDSRHGRLRRRARAGRTAWSARSTRTSRSRASPATSSSSATRRTASGASSAAACASRMRKAQPPTSRSGWAKRPARSDELSHAVSRLRERRVANDARDAPAARRMRSSRLAAGLEHAARADAARSSSSITSPPRTPRSARCRRRTAIVLERFFDESGGMQLVIHAPFGSRINRAWGLALRKRFCRQVQLRAAGGGDRGRDRAVAVDQPQLPAGRRRALSAFEHRAPGAGAGAARCADVRGALALDRGDVARAAALSRRQEGAAAAAAHARRGPDGGGVSRPDRLRGEPRRRPRDSRSSAGARRRSTTACTRRWTSTGSNALLRGSKPGDVDVVARDLPAPSPLALEILNARPYAYLDDAPLEERRTQAVMGRRWADDGKRRATSAGSTPRRSTAVREEAWPDASTADELHDALLGLGFLTAAEVAQPDRMASAARRARTGASRDAADAAPAATGDRVGGATTARDGSGSRPSGCRSSTRCIPRALREPAIDAPAEFAARTWTRDDALRRAVAQSPAGTRAGHRARRSPIRSRCRVGGRRTRRSRKLAAEGVAMRGAFTRARGETNGAIAACSRASIATRSTGCARRSSRSRRRTSCASCFAGSTSRRASSGRARTRSTRSRAAAGLRGAGRGVGIRDPAGAARQLRVHLARRSVPVGPRGVDAPDAADAHGARGQRERDSHDTGHAAAAPQLARVDARGAVRTPRSRRS